MVQWRPRDERCPPLGVSWDLTDLGNQQTAVLRCCSVLELVCENLA